MRTTNTIPLSAASASRDMSAATRGSETCCSRIFIPPPRPTANSIHREYLQQVQDLQVRITSIIVQQEPPLIGGARRNTAPLNWKISAESLLLVAILPKTVTELFDSAFGPALRMFIRNSINFAVDRPREVIDVISGMFMRQPVVHKAMKFGDIFS